MQYSVLRVTVDAIRDEPFNIGVAVWAMDDSFAGARLLDDWDRFIALYGEDEAAVAQDIGGDMVRDVQDRRLTRQGFPAASEEGPYTRFLWTPLRGAWLIPYQMHLDELYDTFVCWPPVRFHPEIAAWCAAHPNE
jgi:hypothetical protein